ncbi:hypothetical protein C0Q70_12008 [Pomacea canaliculata]|uniref:Glucuronosyltransferase n=1 Tax=Pomacea canaliculata TaxID=400727 RepID=A0A2T7P0B5_POMCA|nr:hypothetical protein C0Q70_12008 [Pomacea canaliculata]
MTCWLTTTLAVFVSHCGYDGQYEALFHAVPVVCTPLVADQFYNAERMRVKGMAETVDLNTVSTHELHSTILKVATNTSYKQAITKASELFKIEFGVPVEKAAYWLDHNWVSINLGDDQHGKKSLL